MTEEAAAFAAALAAREAAAGAAACAFLAAVCMEHIPLRGSAEHNENEAAAAAAGAEGGKSDGLTVRVVEAKPAAFSFGH